MRTTLRIDDDVFEAAKSVARSTDRTLGEVISELARRGLAPAPQKETDKGFPVFSVSPGAKPITPEMVRRALDEP